MFNFTKSLRRAAVSSAIALVATVIPGTGFSPASAAPVTPGSVSVSRSYTIQDGSFTVYSGEQISVYSRYSINMSTVDSGETLTYAATGDISGLSTTWNSTTNGQPSSSNTSTFTIPSTKPSVLTLTVTKSFSATSSTTMHYLPALTASNGAFTLTEDYTSISVTVGPITNGYTAKAGDETLNYNLDVCVDMALVEPSDSIELTSTLSQTVSNTFGNTSWTTNSGVVSAISPQTELQRTVPNPEPSYLKAFVYRSFSGLTTGSNYVFSADIKKAGNSVTLASCPNTGGGGGYTPPPPLYSLGGATVSGTFSVGSTITATPNQWSRTSGGAATTTTNTYDWLVCTSSQATSTTNPQDVPCIGMNSSFQFILADGDSVGQMGQQTQTYQSSSLTITQNLLNALSGKYLMVVNAGSASAPSARSNVFMPTCGPISAGLTCSVSNGGTPPVVTPVAPTLTPQTPATSVPAAVKAKKKLTIPAKTAAGLPVTVVASGGCKVKPVVKTVKTKVGKKTVKTKVTTGYTVTMGKKGTTCTITQSNSGNSSYDALNSVSTVTAS